MDLSRFLMPLCGGLLIGASASLVVFTHGRVTGISGMLAGLTAREGRTHRILFLAGLLAAGVVGRFAMPQAFESVPHRWGALVAAGLLVGVGTQLGSGCTSGHGVCGISRFSVRSILATLTFIGTGMISVFVMRRLS